MSTVYLSLHVALTLLTLDSWSFAVIGDTQNRPRILRKAIKDMKTRNLDFVVHLGDIYWCGGQWGWNSRKKIIDSSNLKWYYVIGNHELYACEYTYTTRKRWTRTFYGDECGTFRTFTHKGKRFILLDNATAHMPSGHTARLKYYLSKQGMDSTIIFGHRPLPVKRKFRLRYGPRHRWRHWYRDMDPMHKCKRNMKIWNLFNKNSSKILSYFHGHYHAFRAYSLFGIDMYSSGGGGGKLETPRDFYHYLIVTVSEIGLSIKVIKL